MGPAEQCSQGQRAQHLSIPLSERSSTGSDGSHRQTMCFHLHSELKGFTLTGAGFKKTKGTNQQKQKQKNPIGQKSQKESLYYQSYFFNTEMRWNTDPKEVSEEISTMTQTVLKFAKTRLQSKVRHLNMNKHFSSKIKVKIKNIKRKNIYMYTHISL